MTSHPSWVCGLKPMQQRIVDKKSLSHPSWVCGLKLATDWEEVGRMSHTLRGCVD